VADQALGALGTGPESVRYAQIVRQWSADLTYFAPPETLTPTERAELAARSVSVVEGTVHELVVDGDRLVGVQLGDGCVVPLDALFVPPRFVANDRLLVDAGCAVGSAGWVSVDASGRTSMRGIWAAGNVVDPRAQVITAAGAGSAAAIAINAELVEDDIRTAVRDARPGPTNPDKAGRP
jgi:thioredoxin reductase